MPRKEQALSFEQLYTELENTIGRLEEGKLSLDEALALYERGMELAKQCSGLLDRAEVRIQELAPNTAELDADDNDFGPLVEDDDE